MRIKDGYRLDYIKNLEMRYDAMSEKVSIKLPIRLKRRIDDLKEKMHLDESSLISLLLHDAVAQKEIDMALEEYRKGKISLGEGVLMAKTDYWTFLDILHERKVPANINENDHIKEIKKIQGKKYKQYL